MQITCLIGQITESREDNPKYVKDREKMNAEIDYSEIESVKKFMRLLVKQW